VQISRHRSHQLPADEARRRVERIAARLAERFAARCRWDGDRLHVEHAAVQGTLTLSATEVRLQADLRFPVSLMRAQVEAEIDRLIERELGGS
jgi:putative polyhydroxyalkanoate system protein